MNEEMCQKHDEQIRQIQLSLVEIKADSEHIKGRIDNGLSGTVTKIWDKINEICPDVKENTRWRQLSSKAMLWLVIIVAGGGLVKIVFELFQHGAI